MKSPENLKWALSRLIFIITVLAGLVSFGLLAFILAPLYSWYFYNDINFLKYFRNIPRLVSGGWRIIFEWFGNPEYRIISSFSLTDPPMMGPDLSKVSIRADWAHGSCNGCIKCCIQRDCPLLDKEKKHCRSYGSFYWRYFNCGRYPETARQIKYYQCPKWDVKN